MLELYLISVAIKSTVLLASGLLCLRLLRGRDAAVRHLVCLATLGSADAMTLLVLWPEQWSFLIAVPAVAGATGPVAKVATGFPGWANVLAAIWALGTLAMSVRAMGGWIVLRRVRRRSVHFQNGSGAEVRIADVSTPLTCGILRPFILLPGSAGDWDESRLRAVLLHESAHVRRGDCLAKYVAQATRALLWWNPLAWMLAARLNQEQELACDDVVLAAGVPADTYATILLDVARECSGSPVLGCAMGAKNNAGALRDRFSHLFEWRPEVSRSSRRTAIAIPLLLVLITGISCAEKIYKVGPGIVAPKVLERKNPVYPAQEKSDKTQGTVVLSVVVGTDEHAHDIKVTKSVTPGLDASAVTAVSSWRFQPGTKNGKAVPVRAKIEINFKLL